MATHIGIDTIDLTQVAKGVGRPTMTESLNACCHAGRAFYLERVISKQHVHTVIITSAAAPNTSLEIIQTVICCRRPAIQICRAELSSPQVDLISGEAGEYAVHLGYSQVLLHLVQNHQGKRQSRIPRPHRRNDPLLDGDLSGCIGSRGSSRISRIRLAHETPSKNCVSGKLNKSLPKKTQRKSRQRIATMRKYRGRVVYDRCGAFFSGLGAATPPDERCRRQG